MDEWRQIYDTLEDVTNKLVVEDVLTGKSPDPLKDIYNWL